MNSLVPIVCLPATILCFPVNAALVQYDFIAPIVVDTPGDPLSLEGATYSGSFTFNTDSLPVSIIEEFGNVIAHYDAVSAVVEITNRPNGAPDVTLTPSNQQGYTMNSVTSGGAEFFRIQRTHLLSSPIGEVHLPSFDLFFSVPNFFVGNVPAAPPNPTPLEVGAATGDFLSTPNSDGTQFSYDVVPNYWSVSEVPIPSAVWLFGSGLIGLVGLARRKANA